MLNFYKKGITLVEILVVISILAILIIVVVPSFSKLRERQSLNNAVADVMTSLNKAISQTSASLDSSEYGVRFESNKVIIFKGQVFSSGDATNETINIISPAIISSVILNSVNSIPAELYFNRFSNIVSKTGTITVSTTNFSKIITIGALGTISTN